MFSIVLPPASLARPRQKFQGQGHDRSSKNEHDNQGIGSINYILLVKPAGQPKHVEISLV